MASKPALPPEMVRNFVSVAHSDLEAVEAFLDQQPRLVNATWDWGDGDFESAIQAAAQTGRRDIAALLLDHGARPDIFVAAMLGQVEVVRAMLAAWPDLLTAPGPHGIPLLAFAEAGGEPAAGVVALAQGAGSVSPPLPGGKSMIQIKSLTEIEKMREAGRLVAEAFEVLRERIRPGAVLRDLDQAVEAYLLERGAKPLYKGYRGNPPNHPPFPGVICASVNNEICHGLPDGRALQGGDLVGIDIGLRYRGFCGDACVTFPVGQVTPAAERLLKVAEESMWRGIEAARPGAHLSDIGAAIEKHARKHGYSVVHEWGGHGIGRQLHEPPSVPHTGPGGQGPRLKPGMVFTVEPMINEGVAECVLQDDGWTVTTADGRLSAQHEHTIAITTDGRRVLSKL